MMANSGILAVFKEDESMKAATDSLARKGYGILHETSLFQALVTIIEKKIELIILDIDDLELKEMEFFDIVKRINPNVFILISYFGVNRAKAIKSLERGADSYIIKPIYTDEIFDIINKFMGRNSCNCNIQEDGNNLLEQLALTVAHEINNPLATISGQLQLHLSEMKRSDPNYQVYTTLEEEAQRIAGVVKNLIAHAYN